MRCDKTATCWLDAASGVTEHDFVDKGSNLAVAQVIGICSWG